MMVIKLIAKRNSPKGAQAIAPSFNSGY